MMLDARRIAAALVGESEGFLQSLTLLNSAARCSVPVLLTGEPGTGKNLFARAIHTLRTGNSVPFVTVDGSAATAADLSRGSPHTLYLKRPELLSAGSRALLRQVVTRVSGTVNVIASSESEPAVTGGPHSERGGPFDGIETVCIRLPPLRERSVDVRPLSEYFFRKHSAQLGFCRLDVRPEVHIVLQAQTYGSGNVRELENVVRDSLQRSENGTVTLACLPQHIRPGTVRDAEQNPFSGLARSTPATYGELSALRREIRRICRAEISSAEGRFAVALLASTGGNVSRAARLAGVDRGLFHRLLKRR